jgi:hypothetical protein
MKISLAQERALTLRVTGTWNVFLHGDTVQREAPMSVGDSYRARARELLARAEAEKDELMSADYKRLAIAYLRLADQADRNDALSMDSALTIEFELPPETEGDQNKRRN